MQIKTRLQATLHKISKRFVKTSWVLHFIYNNEFLFLFKMIIWGHLLGFSRLSTWQLLIWETPAVLPFDIQPWQSHKPLNYSPTIGRWLISKQQKIQIINRLFSLRTKKGDSEPDCSSDARFEKPLVLVLHLYSLTKSWIKWSTTTVTKESRNHLVRHFISHHF